MGQLTKRQQVLFDRLVKLGDMASGNLLPINVTEILGFGSFFRGKKNPKDVDVLLRQSNDNPQVQEFVKLIQVIRRDVRFRQTFKTPKAAFAEAFDREHLGLFPGLIDFTEQRGAFLSWLEGYSWRMMFPTTMAEQIGTEHPWAYSHRLLRRLVPNVNVALNIGAEIKPHELGLRSGFLVSIWSRDRIDTAANLREALSPESVQDCQRKELQFFHEQEFRLRGTITVLARLAAQLRDHNEKHKFGWTHAWLRDQAASFGGANLDMILSDDRLLTKEEITKATGQHFAHVDCEENLAERVEDAREQIKVLWSQVVAYRWAANTIVAFWTETNDGHDLEEFVRSGVADFKGERFKATKEVLDSLGFSLIGCV